MPNEIFDEFLQDATQTLRELWEDEYEGPKIGAMEAQSLNDVLTVWFQGKRFSP